MTVRSASSIYSINNSVSNTNMSFNLPKTFSVGGSMTMPNEPQGQELKQVISPQGRSRHTPENPGLTAKMHKRHFVQHNYHDYANEENPAETNSSPSKKGACRRGVPFPEKLHQMLDKIEADGHASVISWQPHGRAFLLKNKKEFVENIMPEYFRQSNIKSFQRQLNLYGFCRLTRGPDKGAYYHELFLRGKPFLSERMVRTRVKGTFIKASSSPESEPNFYAMPPVTVGKNHCEVGPLPEKSFETKVAATQAQIGCSATVENTVQKELEPSPFSSLTSVSEEKAEEMLSASGHNDCVLPRYPSGDKLSQVDSLAEAGITSLIPRISSQSELSQISCLSETVRKTQISRRESAGSLVSLNEAESMDRRAMDAFFKSFDVESVQVELAADDDACLADALDELMDEF